MFCWCMCIEIRCQYVPARYMVTYGGSVVVNETDSSWRSWISSDKLLKSSSFSTTNHHNCPITRLQGWLSQTCYPSLNQTPNRLTQPPLTATYKCWCLSLGKEHMLSILRHNVTKWGAVKSPTSTPVLDELIWHDNIPYSVSHHR